MRECYLDPMAANKEAGDREGWWEGIRAPTNIIF
jgi:hypothetical protein